MQVSNEQGQGFLARAVAWWREHVEQDAFCGMVPADVQRIAHDLSINEDELRDLARTPSGQADLMARMMAARGLDIDAVRAQEPDLVRDMAILCARCGDKRRCARDLRDGVAAVAGEDYCQNVGAFRMLES